MFGLAGLSLRILTRGPYFGPMRGPLDWFMAWDGRWYLGIAIHGYSYDPTQMSAVNFLPVYPMLTRWLGAVVGNMDFAAYLVSNAFCFGAAALLWRLLADMDRKESTANAGTLFFLLGPVAVFFSAIYSESTFLFFALGTMVLGRRQQWALAGACGAIAALSRSLGLLLILPLAIEFIAAHWNRAAWRKFDTWARFACCALPAAGTLTYVAFLTWKFGDPMAYVVSQRHGGHVSGAFWRLFQHDEFSSLPEFYRYWFGAAAITAVLLLALGFAFRIPLSFSAFAAALCYVYLSTRSLEGFPRFFSVVFPFYLVLGRLYSRWPHLGLPLLAISASLLGFSVILFVNGYWFT